MLAGDFSVGIFLLKLRARSFLSAILCIVPVCVSDFVFDFTPPILF